MSMPKIMGKKENAKILYPYPPLETIIEKSPCRKRDAGKSGIRIVSKPRVH